MKESVSVPKPPPEIENKSFNVLINGDIQEAFNKAKIAAPSQGVTIKGGLSDGSLVATQSIFGIKKEVFRGSYKTYGNYININVDYVTLGQFNTAKSQIMQFFANI